MEPKGALGKKSRLLPLSSKKIHQQKEEVQATPSWWVFFQPHYEFYLKLSRTTPPLEGPQVPSTVSEAYRVTKQFCEDFRVLKAQVEILEAENQCLRRIIIDLKNPNNKKNEE